MASASAETTLLAEWLLSGSPIATLTSTEHTGIVTIGDSKIGLKMECGRFLDGSVGANGEDEVTDVLTKIGTSSSLTNKLACTGLSGCSKAETAPEALPWLTQAELLENGTFGDIFTSMRYWTLCEVLGINTEEECTITNGLSLVINATTDVEFTGKIIPNGNCTVGGAEAAELEFKPGDLLAPLTGVLSISE